MKNRNRMWSIPHRSRRDQGGNVCRLRVQEVRTMTARGAVSARAEECAYRKEGCTQECCSPGRRVLEARFVSRTDTGKGGEVQKSNMKVALR